MQGHANIWVFWVLIPVFLLVGLQLLRHRRRQQHMFAGFAKTHHYESADDERWEIEKILRECFTLDGEGLVRSFGQLSSILDCGRLWLFRAVELLDVNPHAQPYSTHFSRIIALFEIGEEQEADLIFNKSKQIRTRLKGAGEPSPQLVNMLGKLTDQCTVRHTLSLTLAGGFALVYLEPLVTGGETRQDLESLVCLASKLQQKLAYSAVSRRRLEV